LRRGVNGVKLVSGYGDKRARPRLRDFKFAPAPIFRLKRVKWRADSSNKS
jgi:hypothetical protein